MDYAVLSCQKLARHPLRLRRRSKVPFSCDAPITQVHHDIVATSLQKQQSQQVAISHRMQSEETDRLQVAECRLSTCEISRKTSTTTTKTSTRTIRSKRRLFIHLNLNDKINKQQEFASPAHKNSLALLLITMGLALQCAYQTANGQQQQQQEVKSNLPTVIVRGFLNYRTTVDGTVLLFTPDAGGSSASQTTAATNQVTISSSSPAALMSSSREPIEPSSTRLRFPSSSTSFNFPIVEPREVPEAPVGRGGGGGPEAADEWRPVQATPPLRAPIQTVFRPTQVNVASGSALFGHLQTPVSQQQQEKSSQPSVQSEDVVVISSTSTNDGPAAAGSAANEPSTSPATTSSGATSPTNPSRAIRPKRPSLGFTGQGTRNGGPRAAGTSRVQSSSQATGEPSNSINGIRKPGLLISSTSTTPAPSGGAETSSPASGSFQSRLANARLRNRFNKRPPIGSTATNSSGSSSQSVAQQVSSQAATPVAVPTGTLLQPAESGEDLILSDQVAAQPRGISPEQSSLESRIGDIFNPGASFVTTPVVGNEEVWSAAAATGESQQDQAARQAGSSSGATPEQSSQASDVVLEPVDGGQSPDANAKQLMSRSGEQRPRAEHHLQRPQLLSGGLSGTIDLQQGQLSNAPLSFEGFFPSEQPPAAKSSSDSSDGFQVKTEQLHVRSTMKNNNDKISGWMGQHNNRFIPRPQVSHNGEQAPAPGHLSHQLAANLNNLVPSFSANIPSTSASLNLKPTPVSAAPGELKTTGGPSVGSLDDLEGSADKESAGSSLSSSGSGGGGNSTTTDGFEKDSVQLQTITKTYSTVMTSLKTRLVPLQVKSSTAIYTITENYVITKMLTAYQTMPLGEFILPEPQSTRSPFDMFSASESEKSEGEKSSNREQPIPAPSNHIAPSLPQEPQAEQPISLDTSGNKSPNDWLHDFSNLNSNSLNQPSSNNNNNQQQQPNLAALLEQQAQEANLAGLGLGEPLDQLASSLDPAADGTINIPDLNNPLVLAAAIQNPQLAAVILAAQQLQLKQRANKLNNLANQQQQHQQSQPGLHPAALQPSYSTSLSTTIKPSTYTVRDTMYTTRLVSFKDGRTVRTRTVSEPGSVIEQVLTTMATEVTPITITIRPTGVLSGALATAPPNQQLAAASNQNTINNALIATQLASLLARRQQQVQPSLAGQANFNPFAPGAAGNLPSSQANQLAVLQQLLGQQQRQQQQQQQVAKYQPNIQQLLQSMQQQPQQQQQQPSTSPSSLDTANSNRSPVPQQEKQQQQQQQAQQDLPVQPTPSLPAMALLPAQPITTTLTSLQVRTYTVHNAFKTIYRTITSTQLITSTIFPGARSSQLPNVG